MYFQKMCCFPNLHSQLSEVGVEKGIEAPNFWPNRDSKLEPNNVIYEFQYKRKISTWTSIFFFKQVGVKVQYSVRYQFLPYFLSIQGYKKENFQTGTVGPGTRVLKSKQTKKRKPKLVTRRIFMKEEIDKIFCLVP